MRVTLRSVTHGAQWSQHELVTTCGRWLSVSAKYRRNTGSFWCRNEETRILVGYDAPVDCMTCLVLEARGG